MKFFLDERKHTNDFQSILFCDTLPKIRGMIGADQLGFIGLDDPVCYPKIGFDPVVSRPL